MKRSRRTDDKHVPFSRVADFGAELRGLGGLQTSHIRALKGSTFGAAGKCRTLTEAERKAIEDKMRADGKL